MTNNYEESILKGAKVSKLPDGVWLGLAQLIELSVNWSIYNRKKIMDMKIQKLVAFNGCSVHLFN